MTTKPLDLVQRAAFNTRPSAQWANAHYSEKRGPMAVIRQCAHCKHFEIVRVGMNGVGRGYGMREGNKARGRMIQHIKSAHPQVVPQDKRIEQARAALKATEGA